MKESSLQKANKLFLIGIGYRPLSTRARELVKEAEFLLASSRLLDVFKRYEEYDAVKDRIKVIDKVPDTIGFIRECFSRSPTPSIVLLASGDPFFFGIGRRMIEEFGKERVGILPDLSSMQEAFARINVPWDDAFFISVHGGPDIAKRRALPYEMSDIPRLIEKHGKLAILTDRQNNPAEIARIVQSALRTHSTGSGQAPQSEIRMHVCERLGYPDETVRSGTVEEFAAMTFAEPNVVILLKSEGRSQKAGVRFGLREEDVHHDRGLITKDEVRAVTIHKLRLPDEGVLWDIGAGSGSVSLEAARLCPGLRVIAVEKDQERINTIKTNMQRHDARKVEVVFGSAPDVLVDLPAPDRVFIGGSSGNLGDIVKLVNEKMPSGIIVINAVTLETLNDALPSLENNGFSVEVTEISVSRSKVVAGKRHMSALNPVFIVKGTRE
jgi:precorrin-6Y C5,15-methyltransferase (decarboxylating)